MNGLVDTRVNQIERDLVVMGHRLLDLECIPPRINMLELERIEHGKRQQTDSALLEAEQMLTERISKLGGTAADLKSLPVVGRLMLFSRGSQRPVWGFFTMYLDWCWLSE